MIKFRTRNMVREEEEGRNIFRPGGDKVKVINQRILSRHYEVTSIDFSDHEFLVKCEYEDFLSKVPNQKVVTLITVSCGNFESNPDNQGLSYSATVSFIKPVYKIYVDRFDSIQEIFDRLEDNGFVSEITVDHAENRKGTFAICDAIEKALLDLEHTMNVIAWSLEDYRYKDSQS